MTDSTVVEGREAEPPARPPDEQRGKASRSSGAGNLIIKLVLVGLVDALLIWALVQCADANWWLAVGFFAAALVAVNFVYLTGRSLPLKYLLPGLLFLIVFQLYTMVFTGFASFTNYGTGHLDDKNAAIRRIQSAERRARRGRAGVPGRADRPGRHGLDADHRPGHRRGVDRDERGPRRPSRTGDVQREGEQGDRRRRVREPQPGHAERRPGATRPVGGAAAAARRGGRDLSPPDLGHPGHGGAAGLRLRRGAGRDGRHRHGRGLPRRPVRGQLRLAPTASASIRAGGSRSASTTTRRCSPTRRCDRGSCRSRRGRSSSPSPRRSSTSPWG